MEPVSGIFRAALSAVTVASIAIVGFARKQFLAASTYFPGYWENINLSPGIFAGALSGVGNTIPVDFRSAVIEVSDRLQRLTHRTPALGVSIGRPASMAFHPHVLGLSDDDLKILNPIVRLDPVFVVNDLGAAELSFEVLFHDVAVLAYLLATTVKATVAVFVYKNLWLKFIERVAVVVEVVVMMATESFRHIDSSTAFDCARARG